MYNRTSISGFTLFEFFMSLIIIAVISGIVVPVAMCIIKTANLNAFKNDAYNVIEAAKIYVAKSNFSNIPEEGIEVSKLNLELKNNVFDGGIIKRIKDDEFKLEKLTRKNYCASGTTSKMKVSDKGCGDIDDTKPIIARVYVKEVSGNNITVIGTGTDNESNIIGYEFNIDGSKYTKRSSSNEYTFKKVDGKAHTIRVKVTNEADKSTISDNIKINMDNYKHITCIERNNLESIQVLKNVVCKYPKGDYNYQYSLDNKEWTDIKLSNGLYKFHIISNQTLYTRVISNNKTIAYNTIKISNIDRTLAGAFPQLLDNMIPVIYDYEKKAWVKADSRVKYFDYDNKIWANAVFVRRVKDTDDPLSHNRDYYLSDKAIGQVVYDNDIIAHYVWIPRFRYELFNVSDALKNPVLIDVKFEGSYGDILYNSRDGLSLTHRSFTYDSEQDGFWVSKYQSNVSKTASCYSDLTTCDKEDILIYANNDPKKITNISISNAHLSTKGMNLKGNIYGMNEDSKPHVLTNLEYGAILYLTNSKFGLENKPYQYSSTGNMSGVFDLNTDYPEMVMGNYNGDSGLNEKNNSGFKKYGDIDWPKYIDYYRGITSKNRILGDATGETNNWYDGYSKFVNGESPFFIRGGVIEGKRSIFNYSSFTGSKNELYTFRTAIIK